MAAAADTPVGDAEGVGSGEAVSIGVGEADAASAAVVVGDFASVAVVLGWTVCDADGVAVGEVELEAVAVVEALDAGAAGDAPDDVGDASPFAFAGVADAPDDDAGVALSVAALVASCAADGDGLGRGDTEGDAAGVALAGAGVLVLAGGEVLALGEALASGEESGESAVVALATVFVVLESVFGKVATWMAVAQ